MGTKQRSELTPLMQQYWDIKAAHQDKILLFRMGDFFEIFCEDAQIAAPLLGITLTSRNKKSGDNTPMCGVPHHSIATPINKLLSLGYKIAICDQVEEASQAKGLVKRAVTRVLTPGMVYDPDTLDAAVSNYLCSQDEKHIGFLEPTTGELFFYKIKSSSDAQKIITALQPVEILFSKAEEISEIGLKTEEQKSVIQASTVLDIVRETPRPASNNGIATTVHNELDQSFAGPECIQRLISYAQAMQSADILKTLLPLEEREYQDRMTLSSDVFRHLEIFKTYSGDLKGSLFAEMNACSTAGGSRLLRQWLTFPLASPTLLQKRLDVIELWIQNAGGLKQIRTLLRGIGDLERKIGKISHPNTHPRDFLTLLSQLEYLEGILQFYPHREQDIERVRFWKQEIERTIEPEVPQAFRDGGFIKKSVSKDLDELIDLATNSQKRVLDLEAREKELTQISSLKIRYNNVFGYYIEITNTHSSKAPLDRYQRKQTLANAERYTTEELVDLERKVITAKTRRAELELEIYQNLKTRLLADAQWFLKLAFFISEVDTITALAWTAIERNYSRPQFSTSGDIELLSCRHPVVERTTTFVANDIVLKKSECLLLTGPNMAGKSTLMRQVAVIALMAQVGSFVPAKRATLPLYDRIFTRIGASDSLTEGLSTFMVEMKETATMLLEATENSLVVLDEVGRGTSTYDGLSLAQAILEYLTFKKKPMVLFATHYHELTLLTKSTPTIHNAHMSIRQDKDRLSFLYTLTMGSAGRSYGVQVAKLAGLPKEVTARAEKLLSGLENGGTQGLHHNQLDLWAQAADVAEVAEPLPEHHKELLEELKTFSIQRMTPLEALNKIAEWQQELS